MIEAGDALGQSRVMRIGKERAFGFVQCVRPWWLSLARVRSGDCHGRAWPKIVERLTDDIMLTCAGCSILARIARVDEPETDRAGGGNPRSGYPRQPGGLHHIGSHERTRIPSLFAANTVRALIRLRVFRPNRGVNSERGETGAIS